MNYFLLITLMRTQKGIIISNKMKKTVVVETTAYKLHPKYKKRFKVSHRFYAHDERELYKPGDSVTIKEIRPLSRLKRWTVAYPQHKEPSS